MDETIPNGSMQKSKYSVEFGSVLFCLQIVLLESTICKQRGIYLEWTLSNFEIALPVEIQK